MYHWRGALVIGAVFVVIGLVYFLLQGAGATMDRAGATLLVVLGGAMAFGFGVILKGSRDL